MIEIILKDFAMWIKAQPVYIGSIAGNEEVFVLRDGELKSAVEVYLEENELPFKIEDMEDCMDEDAKQASIPYTYNAPQHDWKCGYPNINNITNKYYNVSYLHPDSITKSDTHL